MGFFNNLKGFLSTEYVIKLNKPNICHMQYAKIHMHTLSNKIFTSILHNTNGIPNERMPLFYNNSNMDDNSKHGILHYLSMLFCEVQNNFYLHIEKVANKEFLIKSSQQDKKLSKVLVSDYNTEEQSLLYNIFQLRGQTIGVFSRNIEVANTPIFKMAEMRERVTSSQYDAVKNSIQATTEALTNPDRMLTIDAGDDIALLELDTTASEEAIKLCTQEVSAVTGLPISYLGGEGAPSLGDSGVADIRQLDFALQRYFYEYFSPIVSQLLKVDLTYVSQYDTIKTNVKED